MQTISMSVMPMSMMQTFTFMTQENMNTHCVKGVLFPNKSNNGSQGLKINGTRIVTFPNKRGCFSDMLNSNFEGVANVFSL